MNVYIYSIYINIEVKVLDLQSELSLLHREDHNGADEVINMRWTGKVFRIDRISGAGKVYTVRDLIYVSTQMNH